LAIPDNLYLFFDIINDLLNMRAQFIQDWQDEILDYFISVSNSQETGEDQNIMKRAGTIFLALIALILMCLIALVLSVLIRFFPM
jgi:lipopolysaccharide/colanic/teichoic acid biosynthesis glycosyltransferase